MQAAGSRRTRPGGARRHRWRAGLGCVAVRTARCMQMTQLKEGTEGVTAPAVMHTCWQRCEAGPRRVGPFKHAHDDVLAEELHFSALRAAAAPAMPHNPKQTGKV